MLRRRYSVNASQIKNNVIPVPNQRIQSIPIIRLNFMEDFALKNTRQLIYKKQLLFYIYQEFESQNVDKEARYAIQIEDTDRKTYRHTVPTGLHVSKSKLSVNISSASSLPKLQYFQIIMQQHQTDLKGKKNKSLNTVSDQEMDEMSENESEFDLPSRTIRRMFGPKASPIIRKNKTKSRNLHWNMKENLLYKQFLEENIDRFEYNDTVQNQNQKNSKINVQMSGAIKTRTPNQCRSHHQKMKLKHKTVAGIIEYFESLQKSQSDLQSKKRTEEGGLRPLKNESSVSKGNEMPVEVQLDNVQGGSQMELPSQIADQAQQDIIQRQVTQTAVYYIQIQSISQFLNLDYDAKE